MAKMTPRERSPRDPLLDEAADWMLRVQAAPGDSRLLSDLDDWLMRSGRHAAAWATAQAAWSATGALDPHPAKEERMWPAAVPAVHPRRRARQRAQRWAAIGLATALAASLAIVAGPGLLLRLQADHVSATGELRTVALADGSQVELDSASALAVAFTGARRDVTLLAGQAYFTVAPDRARPFVVQAGTVAVTVTGTQFDVGLAADRISVAVTEGEVRVTAPGGTAALLHPGDRLRIALPEGAAARDHVSAQAVAPWRRHRLLVEGASIAQLVNVLRRYHDGAIILTDAALGAQQVTGVFDLSDPGRALRTMVEPHAGRVRELTPWLLVVSADGTK